MSTTNPTGHNPALDSDKHDRQNATSTKPPHTFYRGGEHLIRTNVAPPEYDVELDDLRMHTEFALTAQRWIDRAHTETLTSPPIQQALRFGQLTGPMGAD